MKNNQKQYQIARYYILTIDNNNLLVSWYFVPYIDYAECDV